MRVKERTKIKRLPPQVARIIAAGEVIESPVSVVKELVENALDAGAEEIFVSLRNGGFDEIIVADNGEGLDGKDLPLAIEKFATSKIASLEDLENLSSLGFRGEALPSIAEVSELLILSKSRGVEQEDAHELLVREGKVLKFQPSSRKEGTTVIVRSLFFNVPARRKARISKGAVLSRVKDYMIRLALKFPQKEFLLQSDGTDILSYPSSTFEDRFLLLTKLTDPSLMISFQNIRGRLDLKGAFVRPDLPYSIGGKTIFFLHTRPVFFPPLVRLIDNLFKNKLMTSRPFLFLELHLPPSQVDFNVHPAKKEVRFHDEREVLSFIYETLEEKLSQILPRLPLPEGSPLTTPGEPSGLFSKNKSQSEGSGTSFPSSTFSKSPSLKEENGVLPLPDDLKFLGIFKRTFMLAASKQSLFILDQHVIHERILYEKWKEEGFVKCERLLIPFSISLASFESDITFFLQSLESLGISFKKNKENIILFSLPPLTSGEEILRLFEEMERTCLKEKSFKNFLLDFETRACKASVKKGDHLQDQEAKELIELLKKTKTPYFCPHGRPTLYELREESLLRYFKRT